MLGYLPGGDSVGRGPAPPSGNCVAECQEGREEAACSAAVFFQQQRENTCFAFLFLGLLSLGSVFAWVAAGIAFLMRRSCIRLFIDSLEFWSRSKVGL